MERFGAADAARLLPARPLDMDKTDRGRVIVGGGSVNYPGAPILACLAALRSGGGVVTLLSIPSVCAACASRLPEATQIVKDSGDWLEAALAAGAHTGAHPTAAVVGPGLGRERPAMSFAVEMWRAWGSKSPLVMDADALYALAASPERDSLPPRANAVITPHEREAARLLSCSPEDVRRDRLGAARSLADRWGCAMLKGSGTIVAAREPDLYGRGVFLTPLTPLTSLMEGEPELSVPGSGDVLAGCVGCFMAQGLSPFDAACLGGTLHGIAGRLVRERRGLDGMLASELADALPLAIEVLKSNAAHKGREEFHC